VGLEIAPASPSATARSASGRRRGLSRHFHKTANVLNKVAVSVQVNMKADLRERRTDLRGR
jgi:hypothetical protein